VTATRALHQHIRHLAFPSGHSRYLRNSAIALLVAIAYFLAARLGLALLAKPEEVAVFWPASGFAAGILITLGRGVRVPVALGVVVATIAANLLGDRYLSTSIFKGLCNAGEAMLTAWLLERWFDRAFKLDDLRGVLGFLAAAILAAAAAAVGGAITMRLFHTTAPLLSIWRAWFLSDGLGIVTIAPLLIGFGQLLRKPPPLRELVEGVLALVALAITSAFALTSPTQQWVSFVPIVVILPLLLAVAARCRPEFATGAAFIVAIALVCTTTYGIGRFGDPNVAVTERVHAAQFAMLVTSLCALILAALFAERRRNEEALSSANERLKLALSGAELGAFSVDIATGDLECDERAARMHGHDTLPKTIKEGRCFVHPEDLVRIDTVFKEAVHTGGVWKSEYRVVSAPGHPRPGAVRWVAFEGSIVRGVQGTPVRLLGVTRDITEHKFAEERQRRQTELERGVLAKISAGVPLAEVLEELVRAIEEWSDVEMMASILFLDKEGKQLLHGAAPNLPQAYNEAINGVEIGPVAGSCGTAAFRGEAVFVEDIANDPLWVDYRDLAISHGLRACWSTPVRAANGRVLGTFAIYYREARGPTQRDLESTALIAHTVALAIERHLSEQALRESRERLQLALDGAELGVWSVDLESGRLESDARDIWIHRHDPSAPPTTLAEARAFVHPDDLPNLDSAFAAAQRAGGTCKAEYRVRVSGRAHAGQAHWVGVEGTLVRDAKGRPVRLLGVTRDISESKLAEENLRQREQAFRTLLEALPGAVYTTDASGRVTFFNKAAVDMWGSCPRLGYTQWGGAWSLYRLDGTPMADEASPLALALKEDRAIRDVEVIGVRPDGTRVHFIPFPTPLHDESGALIGAVNMLIDVTELKKAEVALRESETRLRQALTAGQVMAFEWDPRTGLSQRSENAAQILGCEPNQVADGVRNNFIARVHPDDRASFKAHVYGVRPDDPSYSAIFRFLHPDGHVVWLEETAEAEFGSAGRFVRLKGVTRDVSERKRAEERQNLLIAELDHRVKNALACVSVVAQRSREGGPSMDEFLEVLDGRIRSMANSHALLSRGRWQGVSLADLIHCELAPCVGEGSATVKGPDVVLAAEATQAVAMVLHELVTNAAKYGALSSPYGRVSVCWDWRSTGNPRDQLALEWQEMGGPPVVAPKKSGYGTSVIRDLIPYELGGTVDLVFPPGGVRCRLEIPTDWLSSGSWKGRLVNGSGSALLHQSEQSAALLR